MKKIIIGGIVSVAIRNGKRGGNIALVVLYGIGALTGFALAGNYSDLRIWAAWCLICAVLAVVAFIKTPKE